MSSHNSKRRKVVTDNTVVEVDNDDQIVAPNDRNEYSFVAEPTVNEGGAAESAPSSSVDPPPETQEVDDKLTITDEMNNNQIPKYEIEAQLNALYTSFGQGPVETEFFFRVIDATVGAPNSIDSAMFLLCQTGIPLCLIGTMLNATFTSPGPTTMYTYYNNSKYGADAKVGVVLSLMPNVSDDVKKQFPNTYKYLCEVFNKQRNAVPKMGFMPVLDQGKYPTSLLSVLAGAFTVDMPNYTCTVKKLAAALSKITSFGARMLQFTADRRNREKSADRFDALVENETCRIRTSKDKSAPLTESFMNVIKDYFTKQHRTDGPPRDTDKFIDIVQQFHSLIVVSMLSLEDAATAFLSLQPELGKTNYASGTFFLQTITKSSNNEVNGTYCTVNLPVATIGFRNDFAAKTGTPLTEKENQVLTNTLQDYMKNSAMCLTEYKEMRAALSALYPSKSDVHQLLRPIMYTDAKKTREVPLDPSVVVDTTRRCTVPNSALRDIMNGTHISLTDSRTPARVLSLVMPVGLQYTDGTKLEPAATSFELNLKGEYSRATFTPARIETWVSASSLRTSDTAIRETIGREMAPTHDKSDLERLALTLPTFND